MRNKILFFFPIAFLFIFFKISAQSQMSPVEEVQLVADRVIRTSALELNAVIFKPQSDFRAVETIDFNRSFRTRKGRAFAYSIITSSRADDVDFQVSHLDSLKVWINGTLVYENEDKGEVEVKEEERSWVLSHTFTAPLQRGQNTFFIESSTFGGMDWKVMLQPLLPLPEEGDVNVDEALLKFSLDAHPQISSEVAELANWLVLGPFDLSENPEIDQDVRIGTLYRSGEEIITWEMPKMELVTDVFGAHPLWGSLYDWNYHTAGLAWAIGNLGYYTDKQRYKNYLHDYCGFMLDITPYIHHEKYTLNKLTSRFSRLWESQLLDFKVAPTLPYAYRLHKEEDFPSREEYQGLVEETKHYLMNEQLKLNDGTLARETPRVHTVWVDDMFMGVPFMLQASLSAKNENEKQQLLDEAASQVLKFHNKLYDPDMNLYHHAWYSKDPEAELPYWSRANGWGIWAVSEVLLYLPQDHPDYPKILKIYKDHIHGIVKCQNPSTGFFPQLLDEPESFRETSGTAIFTMAIARGINQGWIERKKYERFALKGWEALSLVISESGEVTDICMGTMCTEDREYYRNRPVVENDSHGLLGLIFAGIEMQDLMDNEPAAK